MVILQTASNDAGFILLGFLFILLILLLRNGYIFQLISPYKHPASQIESEKKVQDEEGKKEIVAIMDDLFNSFGIQNPVEHIGLKIQFNNHLYAECVLEIMKQMKLNNKVKLICYPYFKYPGKPESAAFVNIPSNAPPFYSKAFSNLKIEVSIRDDLRRNYETFIYTIGHELSHIVLNGMNHPLKDSEVATDLFVMMRGFSEIMEKGRKYNNQTFGYLSTEQFKVAKEHIEKLYKERRQEQDYQEFKRKFNLP